jgi:hypothetical protein
MEVYDFMRRKNLRDFQRAGVMQIQPIGGAMKRHQKLKKQNMKTRNLLMIIGVAALAAITINVNASDALLSPRAAGNQIKVAPAVAGDRNLVAANQDSTVSSRSLGNQTLTVASVANDVNPVMECHKMIASPKAIQACAEHPTAMSGCCKPAVADNTAH